MILNEMLIKLILTEYFINGGNYTKKYEISILNYSQDNNPPGVVSRSKRPTTTFSVPPYSQAQCVDFMNLPEALQYQNWLKLWDCNVAGANFTEVVVQCSYTVTVSSS